MSIKESANIWVCVDEHCRARCKVYESGAYEPLVASTALRTQDKLGDWHFDFLAGFGKRSLDSYVRL